MSEIKANVDDNLFIVMVRVFFVFVSNMWTRAGRYEDMTISIMMDHDTPYQQQ